MEGVRGVACVMVVFSHLVLTFFPYVHLGGSADRSSLPVQSFFFESPFGVVYSGTAAVFIFFVLSGYVLSCAALTSLNHRQKIAEMCVKRYPRLAIPALASCLLGFAGFSCFHTDSSHLSEWINAYGALDSSLFGAIYSGTIDSFFVGNSDYNPVLWTMKIELLGSFLIFAICYFRAERNNFAETLIVVGTSLLIIPGVNGSKTALGLVSFLLGHIFYLHGRNISSTVSTPLLLAGLYLAGVHQESASYSILYTFYGEETYKICNFLSGILVVYPVIFDARFNTLFSSALFVYLGRLSFSAYLVHLPIIATVGVGSFNVLSSSQVAYHHAALLASLLSIACVYCASLLFHRYIDQPGIALSSRMAKKVLTTSGNTVPQPTI